MLEEQIINQHSSFLESLKNHQLDDQRNNALFNFGRTGFPQRKDEEYKYTSFSEIIGKAYNFYPKKESDFSMEIFKRFQLGTDISDYLVFVNGEFQERYSTISRSAIIILSFEKASKDKKYKNIFYQYFNRIASANNPFVQINTAYCRSGFFLLVPRNTVIKSPIHIFYFSKNQNENIFYPLRNLVVVEDGAQMEIIESHHNLDKTFVFTDSVTEIFVSPNATIRWDKLQNDSKTSYMIDNTFVKQEKDTTAIVNTFSFGGKLTRNNLQFYHNGDNINSYMNGVTLINEEQLVDHHTTVFHNCPNCESFQNYKGIFAGKSHGVFNGSVYVHKDAQKTNAYQQNNNVLLSEGALIDTKPQLEIFADDVKCSHGCTVGQLDKDSLFYLRTRGIPQKEAKKLLLQAFAYDAINNTNILSLKNKIYEFIRNKLDA